MVKLNYSQLKFDHLVIFEQDHTIFLCARQADNNHTRLFLVFDSGNGHVYTRNGSADSWEQLIDGDAEIVRSRISRERLEIPVYKINGTHNS